LWGQELARHVSAATLSKVAGSRLQQLCCFWISDVSPPNRKLSFSNRFDGFDANGIIEFEQIPSPHFAARGIFGQGSDFLGKTKSSWAGSPFLLFIGQSHLEGHPKLIPS
jgi:hypothetical protein